MLSKLDSVCERTEYYSTVTHNIILSIYFLFHAYKISNNNLLVYNIYTYIMCVYIYIIINAVYFIFFSNETPSVSPRKSYGKKQ